MSSSLKILICFILGIILFNLIENNNGFSIGAPVPPCGEIKWSAFDEFVSMFKNIPLSKIPPGKQTAKMVLKAVSKDGMELKYVESKFLTEEVAMAAVKENGNALQFVPKYLPYIYEDIAKPALILRQHVRMSLKNRHHMQ